MADLLQPQETGDDELVMLKRLISEGRISGLNDKPPAFKPPTPPSKTASTAKKAKAPKSPAPKTPDVNKTSSNRQGGGSPVKGSEERPRKNREAPPPPPTTSSHPIKAQPETSEIKFISGRRIHSVEDLQEEDQRQRRPEREGRREERSEAVQRSTSMHLTRGKRRNCLLQVLYSTYKAPKTLKCKSLYHNKEVGIISYRYCVSKVHCINGFKLVPVPCHEACLFNVVSFIVSLSWCLFHGVCVFLS